MNAERCSLTPGLTPPQDSLRVLNISQNGVDEVWDLAVLRGLTRLSATDNLLQQVQVRVPVPAPPATGLGLFGGTFVIFYFRAERKK